jgi:hypothetical protein
LPPRLVFAFSSQHFHYGVCGSEEGRKGEDRKGEERRKLMAASPQIWQRTQTYRFKELTKSREIHAHEQARRK